MRAGAGVARILATGGHVAVGLEAGGALLFQQHDLGAPVSELGLGGSRCTAAACSPDGNVLLLGGHGLLQRVALSSSPHPSPEPLKLGGGQPGGAVACIACQEHAPVFAVALGSCVHVLDEAGREQRCIGPLPQPVQQLAWAGDALVAATPAALHTWTHSGAQDGPVLPSPSPGAAFLNISASPQSPFLAAACAEREVHCWDLATLLGADDRDPLRLRDFEAPVTCMAWAPSGRYLATADGADCAVWDLSDASFAKRGSSIVCCGHEPRTTITAIAFQPDGPLLATASSSGKVALFDCQQFRRGGVLAPAAFTRLDQAPDAITALLWLPGGRLAVGDCAGRLVCLQLMTEMPPPQSEAVTAAATLQQQQAAVELSSGLARLQVGAEGEAATSLAAPATAADGHVAGSGAGATAAVALSRPDSRSLSHQLAPGPTTPLSGTVWQDSTCAGGVQGYGEGVGEMRPLRLPITATRQSSGSSGQQRRARGARGGASRSGSGAAAAAATSASEGGPSGGSAGFSASLMHHIQAIRENPPQAGGARSDQQQLVGWGLGSPSGAHVPWMMMAGVPSMVPPAGPHMAAGQVPLGGPSPTAAAGHTLARYQAQQAAMMQHMGTMQQAPGSMAIPAGYLAVPSPASQAPAGTYQAVQAMPAMYPVVGGPAAGMPPQQMMATQWMPYMQQVQQWAGTAPGYMMYQHPQYAAAAVSLQSAAVRHSGGAPSAAGSYAAVGPGGGMPGGGASGRLSPMGSGAFSPRTSAGGGHSPAFAYRRMDSGGAGICTGSSYGPGNNSAFGGSRQASLEATEAAVDRENNRDNNRAGSPRGHSSRARGGLGPGGSRSVHGSSAASPYSASSPSVAAPASGGSHELLHPLQPSSMRPPPGTATSRPDSPPLHIAGAAAAAAAAATVQQQQEALEEASNEQHTPSGGSAAASSAPKQADSGAGGGGNGQAGLGAASGLEAAASMDLNNADMNNRAMSSSEETSSQPDVPGAGAAADGAISTVYVGNLPGTVDEYLLMCAFAPFGPITHVQVIKEKGSTLSRGYGFVSYAHPIYATVAMQHMNQQVLFGPFAGQRIKVAPSKRH